MGAGYPELPRVWRAMIFSFCSMMIEHAFDEHRDQMLEMYVSIGHFKEIKERPRNIGSEALTAYMFHQTSNQSSAFICAMFAIEGLGHAKPANGGDYQDSLWRG